MSALRALLSALVVLALAGCAQLGGDLGEQARVEFTITSRTPVEVGEFITVEASPCGIEYWVRLDASNADGDVVLAQWQQNDECVMSFRTSYTPSWEECDGDIAARLRMHEVRRGVFRAFGATSDAFVIQDSDCEQLQ